MHVRIGSRFGRREGAQLGAQFILAGSELLDKAVAKHGGCGH
jgi:hypothetical protein